MSFSKEKRVYTQAEKEAMEHTQRIIDEYRDNGYSISEQTIDIKKANINGIVLSIPLIILLYVVYFYFNRRPHIIRFSDSIIVMAAFLISIFVHEFLHGLTWKVLSGTSFENIRYGFIKEYLTPYCSVKVPISGMPFLAGALMPGIILGLIPAFIAIIVGNAVLLKFAVLSIIGALGDIQISAVLIKKLRSDIEQVFIDHPSEIGFYILEKERQQ